MTKPTEVLWDKKIRHCVLLNRGEKQPDIYTIVFGLSMKMYTVKSLKETLNLMPDDAYLSNIHYRPDFQDGKLIFTKE